MTTVPPSAQRVCRAAFTVHPEDQEEARIMKRFAFALFATLISLSGAASAVNAGGNSIGGGLHYLRNLADIKNDSGVQWDNNSFGIIGSFQHSTAGLLKLEADAEYIFDFAGTNEGMWIPSGWVLAGHMIYGGAGIGIGH